MTSFAWGCLVFGLWLGLFLALELLALFHAAPWPTLSATSWALEDRWKAVRVIFLAGLAVLLAHIVFRFP